MTHNEKLSYLYASEIVNTIDIKITKLKVVWKK